MTLPKENLDNKTYSDLLKEAISRIPVYAPEWTDHNVHDPGITFLELFAWLTEMQIYRLNRISDKSYRKFLKLMGIPKLKPASAAKVDVTFSLQPGVTQAEVPTGTIVAAVDPITGEDILFQTEQKINVVSKELSTGLKVLSYTAEKESYIDNTEANKNKNVYFYAFGTGEPKVNDGLYIGFKENPGKEITLAFYLLNDESFKKDESSVLDPSKELIWEYSDSVIDEKGNPFWNQVEKITDETINLRFSGKIIINIDKDMGKTDLNKKAECLFWLKCSVGDERNYQIPPKIDCILLNTVSATHAIRRNDLKENTFSSTGMPNFYIDLKYAPVLDQTLTIFENEPWTEVENFNASKPEDRHYTVDRNSGKVIFGDDFNGKIPSKDNDKDNIIVSYWAGGSAPIVVKFSSKGKPGFYVNLNCSSMSYEKLIVNVNEPWTEVEDFDASKPGDTHYSVDLASGRVTFGNGINGKIPPKGTDNIEISYFSGGGTCGNVKPEAITRIISNDRSKDILGKVTVTNNKAASGGTEAETLEEAIQRAKKELKEVTRAVTSADYEYLAMNTPGLQVARAKALPRYHPSQDREVPGIVSVIVVPKSSPDNPNPMPSQNFVRAVYRHLEKYRLLTTELFVLPPKYVNVSIAATIVVKPKSLPIKVKESVENKLKEFLHPVLGGFDRKGWPFGRSVYVSEIYEVIDGVEGVDYVEKVSLISKLKSENGDTDISPTATGNIEIPAEGLVSLLKTDITAREEN